MCPHNLVSPSKVCSVIIDVSFVSVQGSCYVWQPLLGLGRCGSTGMLPCVPPSLVWLVGYNRQGSFLIGLFPIPMDILAYMYSSLLLPLSTTILSQFIVFHGTRASGSTLDFFSRFNSTSAPTPRRVASSSRGMSSLMKLPFPLLIAMDHALLRPSSFLILLTLCLILLDHNTSFCLQEFSPAILDRRQPPQAPPRLRPRTLWCRPLCQRLCCTSHQDGVC
jgi:hypothetical protein